MLLLAALLVVTVLALNLVSALVPPLDQFLARVPALAIGLVAATITILLLTLRGARRG